MRQLSNEFVCQTANIIWQQIKATATSDIIGSWAVSKLYAQEVVADEQHYASLVMRVQGFVFAGYVIISLDEGQDLYHIFTAESKDANLVKRHDAIYCDMLVSCLDKTIERGTMTDTEYQQRVRETYFL